MSLFFSLSLSIYPTLYFLIWFYLAFLPSAAPLRQVDNACAPLHTLAGQGLDENLHFDMKSRVGWI
jgi:hypothetical protein